MNQTTYFAGIDIGSSTIKIVIIDLDEKIIGHIVRPTGSRFNINAQEALSALCTETGVTRQDIKYLVSTGYGRKLFKEANEIISEITANATGAIAAGKEKGQIRTILNIGGQDSKVIILDDNGIVQNFVMNDKCAAGTGRFLEMTSRNLEVDIDELGEIHTQFDGTPLQVNSTCAVFAESEIISMLANGHQKPEIVAGVHYSIARRMARLANRAGIKEKIIFDGGTALNAGMKQALEDELMREIHIPALPQVTTALGAALIAKQKHFVSTTN